MTLPNFIIIGAAKAGTTALYEYLGEHPDVFVSPVKETNFFSSGHPIGTQDEYEAQFAGVRGERAIGEASVQYIASKNAAAQMRDQLPDVKLIAMLRNPADRAFSHYLMQSRGDAYRQDPRSIDQVFADFGSAWAV